ncbi:MAG: tetratricopeptide repeat protein [Candidatus Cloacimonetes bacterium]|nr:tetratricopeptide repeat protein [Candidatus Cloacimonadota bacterium]
MKNILIVSLLICLAAFAYAEAQSNSLNEYLNNPNAASYKLAVSTLCDNITKGENINQNKLNLAYITNHETSRLMEQLQADAKTLAAGERFMLGNILLSQEEYTKAIAIYDGLNKDYPNWSCPWRHNGEALYRLKQYDAAVIALQQAIDTKEDHYDAYVWMAMALKEQGNYKEALKNLETALTMSPETEESEDEAVSQEKIQALLKELRAKVK